MAKTKQYKLVKTDSGLSPGMWWGGLALIILASWFAYLPAFQNGFAYDDLAYVNENKFLRYFSWQGVFSEFVLGNYHPLTILSIKIDHNIGGFSPRPYHIQNVIWHILATLAFTLYAARMLKNRIAALMGGLLFGIHPLHTESVAWIAERKDVLYTFFFFAGLYTWVLFRESSDRKWYITTLILFVLSCLSKGMAVVFPMMLLLTDYIMEKEDILLKPAKWRIPEKIPFFILSIGFGILAFYAQSKFDAVYSSKYTEMNFNFMHKVLMAIWGFVFYPIKLLLPANLCAYHPYPNILINPLPTYFYIAPIGLAVIGALAWYFRSKTRMVTWAVLFYIFGILPVLQIVPVGENIVAERYAYVSTAGLMLLAGYAFAEGYKRKGILSVLLLGIVSIALIWATHDRIPAWKDNLSLFKDVAEKYPDSPVAHNNTGYGYEQLKEYRKALHHYFIASTLRKNYADVLYNIGSVYGEDLLMPDSGIYYLRQALAANPKKTEAYNNMATFFYQKDMMDSSIYYYEKVLEARPDYPLGLYNIGCAYYKIADYERAVQSYQRAVELDPKFAECWLSLGNTWAMLKDTEKQMQAYKTAAQQGSENAKTFLRQNNITW